MTTILTGLSAFSYGNALKNEHTDAGMMQQTLILGEGIPINLSKPCPEGTPWWKCLFSIDEENNFS